MKKSRSIVSLQHLRSRCWQLPGTLGWISWALDTTHLPALMAWHTTLGTCKPIACVVTRSASTQQATAAAVPQPRTSGAAALSVAYSILSFCGAAGKTICPVCYCVQHLPPPASVVALWCCTARATHICRGRCAAMLCHCATMPQCMRLVFQSHDSREVPHATHHRTHTAAQSCSLHLTTAGSD